MNYVDKYELFKVLLYCKEWDFSLLLTVAINLPHIVLVSILPGYGHAGRHIVLNDRKKKSVVFDGLFLNVMNLWDDIHVDLRLYVLKHTSCNSTLCDPSSWQATLKIDPQLLEYCTVSTGKTLRAFLMKPAVFHLQVQSNTCSSCTL